MSLPVSTGRMMSSPSTMDTYLARFDDLGLAGFLDEFQVPVLVGGDFEAANAPPGSWGFHTTHARATDIAKAMRGSAGGPGAAALVNCVFEIRKRSKGLFPGQIGVGRARNVDVVVASPRVSKYHAYFLCEEDAYLIADAGSANGTKVDGETLEARIPHPLNDSATISLGGLPFLFFTPRGFAVYLEHRLDD